MNAQYGDCVHECIVRYGCVYECIVQYHCVYECKVQHDCMNALCSDYVYERTGRYDCVCVNA